MLPQQVEPPKIQKGQTLSQQGFLTWMNYPNSKRMFRILCFTSLTCPPRPMLVAAMTPALQVFIKPWKNQGINLLELLRLKTENGPFIKVIFNKWSIASVFNLRDILEFFQISDYTSYRYRRPKNPNTDGIGFWVKVFSSISYNSSIDFKPYTCLLFRQNGREGSYKGKENLIPQVFNIFCGL
jgi:hypothetical protein